VVLAPDCFGSVLSARQAAAALAAGWAQAAPHVVTDCVPLSDGGPGFVEVLDSALGGRPVAVTARGPLGEPVAATVLLAADGTAYCEAASVCGRALLATPEPWRASSAGVADLLRAALEAGARRVVVGVGGTASTDGGRAVVEALGAWPAEVALVAATDVDTPLLGPGGAAAVFGPQKGADPAMVAALEERLTAWSHGQAVRPEADGAGAGGGLGYGLLVLGARREPGAALVASAVGLRDRIAAASLVVTGEGRMDAASLRGKVVRGVAWTAQQVGRPVVVLAGRVEVGRREYAAAGIEAAYSVDELTATPPSRDPQVAADRLAAAAQRVARTWTPSR